MDPAPGPSTGAVRAHSAPPQDLAQLQSTAEAWTAHEVLRWAVREFQSGMEIASAFGAEGVVLIDIASRVVPDLNVFILDTGFLFPQTIDLIAKVERRYGIQVERILPHITADEQSELYRPALWTHDPDLCCNLRKIVPLRKKLTSLKAWITAIRRDQAPSRKNAAKIEWDSRFQLTKINPLADWTHDMVWAYIRDHSLSYNPLHDHHYPSLGCVQCTRPVHEGEDPRAGRWPGFSKQECGLHASHERDRTNPIES